MTTATKNAPITNTNKDNHTNATREPTIVAARDLSNYKPSSTWPDVRGWEVVNQSGELFGHVDRLMVDPTAHQLRYLSVEKKAESGKNATRALLPVGTAKVETGKKRIQLSSKVVAAWDKLCQISSEVITRDTEIAILQALGVTMTPAESRNIPYTTPMFDAKLLFEPAAGSTKV